MTVAGVNIEQGTLKGDEISNICLRFMISQIEILELKHFFSSMKFRTDGKDFEVEILAAQGRLLYMERLC